MTERKEAVRAENRLEWKDAATHRTPTWPLAGYAPGNYMGTCVRCGHHFPNMDKRATHCLPCAIDSVKGAVDALRTEVRRLETENKTLKAAIQIARPLSSMGDG